MRTSNLASVALCTYNGERFIREQIESILCQSSPVDEIIICDDRSKDATISILKEIQLASNTPIKIFQNDSTLGVIKNFVKAISLCSGDIIFLSDQDDVWDECKVQKVLSWFKDNPQKEVVFTDARLIDENGASIKASDGLFDSIGFSHQCQKYFDTIALDIFLNYNRATGASMAIRKTFFESFSIRSNGEGIVYPLHDAQIALGAIAKRTLGFIPFQLMSYRIHSGQECGIGGFVKRPKRNSVFNLMYSKDCLLIPEVVPLISFLKEKNRYRHSKFGEEVFQHRNEYMIHYGKSWSLFAIYDFMAGIKNTIASSVLKKPSAR